MDEIETFQNDQHDNQHDDQPESGRAGRGEGTSRRDFLGLSWKVLGAVLVGQAGYTGLRFLSSRQAEGSAGQIVSLGVVGDFAPNTVTPFDNVRVFLVRFEDGGFLALHQKCTHLACVVNWNAAEGRFHCPCHGSVFEQDGAVINPPAPRPLDRFEVSFDEAGRVLVDTRTAIRRDDTTADVLVYAPPELEASDDEPIAGKDAPAVDPLTGQNASAAPGADSVAPTGPAAP